MRDQQRVDQMNEGAAFLRSLPTDKPLTTDELGRIANIALGMEKFAILVLDRDEGPNREHVSEVRRLGEELALANGVAKEIDLEFAAYRDKTKSVRHENSALLDKIKGLEANAPKLTAEPKAEAKKIG